MQVKTLKKEYESVNPSENPEKQDDNTSVNPEEQVADEIYNKCNHVKYLALRIFGVDMNVVD